MPTYRELYDKLATLSAEQLDSEIRIIPLGYTDSDAATILRYDLIPEVLEFSKVSRDVYYCNPSEEDAEFMEAGVVDFSEDEAEEMGIDQDGDYTLICKKGALILKIKDGIMLTPMEEAKVGNLDTSILHL